MRALIATVAVYSLLGAAVGQTIKVDVILQQVTATVTDSDGAVVTDLRSEDFTVEVDSVPQQIANFAHDVNVPFSVGLVLDTSNSMERTVFAAKGAAATFIAGLHPRDESFLMTFDNNATIRQGFTHQPTKLFDALKNVTVGGGTVLTQTVTEAAKKIGQATNRKHALIVISDGGDIFATRSNLHPFLKQIPEMETLIYSIHMDDLKVTRAIAASANSVAAQTLPRNTAAFQPELATELMQSIANESGGRYFHIDLNLSPTEISRQLSSAFDEIFRELRAQYTIGFYPTSGTKSSTSVQVRTINPVYRVRASAPQAAQPVVTDDDPYETALSNAETEERQGRHASAIQALEHATTLNDSDPRAFRVLGRLYIEEKQFQKAVESFNELGSLVLLNGADHFFLGTALLGLDKAAAAEEQLTQAIVLTPDNPQAYLRLYSAYMKLNKPADALSSIEKYLKLFPNDPNYAESLELAKKLRSTLKPTE